MFVGEQNPAGSLQDAGTRPVADRAEICARIRTVRGALAALGARSVRLFGSAARDALRPDSEVDILIEFDGPTRFRAFMATRRLLERTLGRRVDLVTPAALKPSLAARIAQQPPALEAAVHRLGQADDRS